MDQTPRRGIHALASMLPRVTAPIFKARGFAEAGILTDWPAIVGPHLARHTMPEKIAFPRGSRSAGTLHIVTESAFAPELQHLEPQVIERINGYFGYGAVARLSIHHGRVTHAPLDRVVTAPLDSGRATARHKAISSPQSRGKTPAAAGGAGPIGADDPLGAALDRLGSAVRDRQEPDEPAPGTVKD
jgi:hypothetical protein